MARTRVIAVGQTVPVRGDVGANIDRHLRLVTVAAGEQAEILVFPELSLTGYELDLGERLAFSPHDPRLDPLIEAAASASITLVVGAPARLGSALHIGAVIITPDGGVDIYTKQRLGAFGESARCDGIVPPAEATFFQAGDRDSMIRLQGGSAAVAICADTGRPSHPKAAADRGARTYLASMFVIPSEFERETEALGLYARQHSMAVAFANYGGPSGGLASAGKSAIWSDRGELLVQLDASGPGVAVAAESDGLWRGKAIMLDAHRTA